MTRKEIISYIKETKGLSDYIKTKYNKAYIQVRTEDLEKEIRLYKKRTKTPSSNSIADVNIVSNNEVQEVSIPTLNNEERLAKAYNISNKIHNIETELCNKKDYLQNINNLDLTVKDTNNNPIRYLITCTGYYSSEYYRYYNIEIDNVIKDYIKELLEKEIKDLTEQLILIRHEFAAL